MSPVTPLLTTLHSPSHGLQGSRPTWPLSLFPPLDPPAPLLFLELTKPFPVCRMVFVALEYSTCSLSTWCDGDCVSPQTRGWFWLAGDITPLRYSTLPFCMVGSYSLQCSLSQPFICWAFLSSWGSVSFVGVGACSVLLMLVCLERVNLILTEIGMMQQQLFIFYILSSRSWVVCEGIFWLISRMTLWGRCSLHGWKYWQSQWLGQRAA